METAKTSLKQNIIQTLLPDATPSRRQMLERVLSTMSAAQLEDTDKAIDVALTQRKMSLIRDIVESRNLLAIAAISKWETMVNTADIESALNQQFSSGDSMYDVYSPSFDAHVEAYVTYHTHCSNCIPHDVEAEYDLLGAGFTAPPHGHYVDYLQDFDLMDLVEEHPDMVTELVRLAAERRGIDPDFFKEYLKAETSALSGGLL